MMKTTATETLAAALPDDVESLAEQLLDRACADDLTLATAESCTGGLVSSILTDVEGKSHAFERGFTVYTDGAKTDMLGVPRAVIEAEGAVSKVVAIAMAEGALRRSDADIALAITGFAGSAGPGNEPGLVHLACMRRGSPPEHREMHFGDVRRSQVRINATRVALEMMLAAISQVQE